MYPEYANINGKEYKIDTDYNVALECFKIADDDSITDYERVLAVSYLLFGVVPDDEELNDFVNKAKLYLQCGKTREEQEENKKDMDFIQDRSYINSSFMSDYKVDLSKTDLHFWQFIELLEGLTENCSLNRIRDLRNYDLSEIKDAKQRNKIEKLKKKFALKQENKVELNQEQLKNINDFYEKIGI